MNSPQGNDFVFITDPHQRR